MTNNFDRNVVPIIPASSEPITLDEAKAQCRVDITDDDDLITDLITTAREKVENHCRRTLLATTYELRLDHFNLMFNNIDGDNWYGGFEGKKTEWSRRIWLPRPPLLEVLFVKYFDANGVEQTLDPSTYTVESGGFGQGFIEPIRGASFPTAQKGTPYRIQYQAGYESCPSSARTAIKLLVAHLYRNRMATSTETLNELPFGVKAILSGLIWGSYT